jgi:hypothetical protein
MEKGHTRLELVLHGLLDRMHPKNDQASPLAARWSKLILPKILANWPSVMFVSRWLRNELCYRHKHFKLLQCLSYTRIRRSFKKHKLFWKLSLVINGPVASKTLVTGNSVFKRAQPCSRFPQKCAQNALLYFSYNNNYTKAPRFGVVGTLPILCITIYDVFYCSLFSNLLCLTSQHISNYNSPCLWRPKLHYFVYQHLLRGLYLDWIIPFCIFVTYCFEIYFIFFSNERLYLTGSLLSWGFAIFFVCISHFPIHATQPFDLTILFLINLITHSRNMQSMQLLSMQLTVLLFPCRTINTILFRNDQSPQIFTSSRHLNSFAGCMTKQHINSASGPNTVLTFTF